MTKPRDLANSVNTGPLAGFRNLIINGNPVINQRAYVSGTATGGANEYTLDRWRVVTSGQNLAFTATAGIVTCTAPAGGVEQVVEGPSILGGTYVLNWDGTATATINGNAVAKGGTVTLTGGSNATVRLTGGTFTKVQLEPGRIATAFEQRPAGIELMLCQRYYYRVVPRLGGEDYAVGWNTSTTETRHSLFFPVSMRVAPTTLEQSGTASDYSVRHAAATTTCSAVPAFYTSSTNSAVVTLTVASGLTAGQGSNLRPASTAAYLAWSAEL